VLRFLTRRFTRTEADAEDLYQETLILALEKIRGGEVQEPERLGAFLRSVAKNLSTQQYRGRRYGVEKSAAELPDASDEGQAGALDDLIHRERSELTRALLSEMTVARDREVLVRYYLREEKSSGICADLGIDGDHFYRVLSRARKRYRQLWDEGPPRQQERRPQ